MNKTLGSLAVLLFAVALTVGCGDKKTPAENPPDKGGGRLVSHDDVFEVCGKCGHIELSDHVCKTGKGIEICSKCELHKGSPGCCKKDENIHVCKLCGAAFDLSKKHACNITDKCSECGRQKGSPGCCIDTKSADVKPKTKTEPVDAPPKPPKL